MKNGDKPVYPIVNSDGFPSRLDTVTILADNKDATGLTKREYFAAMAMAGGLANPEITRMLLEIKKLNNTLSMNELLARDSVEMADALLKQLEK